MGLASLTLDVITQHLPVPLGASLSSGSTRYLYVIMQHLPVPLCASLSSGSTNTLPGCYHATPSSASWCLPFQRLNTLPGYAANQDKAQVKSAQTRGIKGGVTAATGTPIPASAPATTTKKRESRRRPSNS